MVAWKLKILWLFLTLLLTGCVVKSEENEFETNVKNLDPDSDANIPISRADYPITDELTTANDGNSKKNKFNNVNMQYEKPGRYNTIFENGPEHLNNSNENKDARDLNLHAENINKDFDKAPYEENDKYHVKTLDGTSIHFTKLDANNSSTSPTNEEFEFHLKRNPKFGLHTNSSTSAAQNDAESTTASSISAENEEHKEINVQATDWKIEQENIFTTETYDSSSKSRKYLFNSEYLSDQNQKLEKSSEENWRTGGENNGFTTIDNLDSSNIKKEENVKAGEMQTESSDLNIEGISSSEHEGDLLDIFNKSNITLSDGEPNEDNAETANYNREIDSQIISNASIEDDSEGSGDGFNDNFTPLSLSANDNEEQSFNAETSDMDGQETLNTTVEDIFSNADSDFKYTEPEINSTSPKNDVIERWLTAENEGFTLHNHKSGNISISGQPYIDFDADSTGYHYGNRTVDNEEEKHNLSETEAGSKLNFPIPERSTTDGQILLQADRQADDADDINTEHSSPSQEQETTSPIYSETKIQSVLQDFNHHDEFSQAYNLKDTVFINNPTFQEENNKSTHEHTNKILSSNLHHDLNATDFKNTVHDSNTPAQISEQEFTETSPELVSTTQNVLSTNDDDLSNILLSNYTRNLQDKLINQYIKDSETPIDNNSVEPQENANKSSVESEDFHNSTHELTAAQLEIYNQNISELNVGNEENRRLLNLDTNSSNTSMSTLKLNEQSVSNDLGKTAIDDGATESQIFKPIVTMLSKETSNTNSTQTSTPPMFANTYLDEIIFNEQLTEANTSSLGYQNDTVSSTHVTASDSAKLATSNNPIEERISGKQFPGSNNPAESKIFIEKDELPNMSLLENERNFNITTESRMALLEDNVETNIFPMNTSVTQKPTEVISDYSYFYGRVNTDAGTVCASLTLNIKIFVNNTRIHLPQNISVEENHKLQNTDILLKWEAADNLHNISTSFHVRCENMYCLMDGIHVAITKRTNTEILQNDIVIVKAQRKNLELFKTELGTIYQNNAETILSMKHGIKIYLDNVRFLVAKDLCLSNQKGVKSESLLADYRTELIGGSVGILLLGGVALFTFKKLRQAKESFKPTIG